MSWSSISIETFHWIFENEKLNMKGILCLSNCEESELSDLNVEGIEFLVANELTPSGKTMPIINFSRPIVLNNMKFGLLEKDVQDDYFTTRLNLLDNRVE